jgi:hypothetical protein
MFEKFTAANIETFRQRYLGTYGFFTREGKPEILVQIADITDGGCSFIDESGLTYTLKSDSTSDIGFTFAPPESRYYNTEKGLRLVLRKAVRQFQRGITDKNVSIQVPGSAWKDEKVSFSTLKNVYNYIPALQAVAKGSVNSGVAVSPFIALHNGLIYLLDEVIGSFKEYLEDKSIEVKFSEPELWGNEVINALKPLYEKVTHV